MRKISLVLILMGILLITTNALAQSVNFSGTYTMQGEDAVITLTLNQDGKGNITGSLSSTTGLSFTVEGIVEEGVALGACYNDEMGVYFESGFDGEILYFILIEPDENNMPDYNKMTELVFTRQGAGSSASPESKPKPSLGAALGSGSGGEASGETTKEETPEKSRSSISESSEIKEGEIGDKNWGFKFTTPKDWVYQRDGETVILGHNTIAGMLVVNVHRDSPFEKMKAEFADGLNEEGVSLHLVGELKQIDEFTVSGNFEGTLEGTQVKAYSIGTISPLGGCGAYIVAVTTPEKFEPELTGRVDEIFKSMVFFKVEASPMQQKFVGRWKTVTSHTETILHFYEDGSFSRNYEAGYSAPDSPDSGGWAVASRSGSSGTWRVVGNEEHGTITLNYNDGDEVIIEYKVQVSKGKTYWNEYWFNGVLYHRA